MARKTSRLPLAPVVTLGGLLALIASGAGAFFTDTASAKSLPGQHIPVGIQRIGATESPTAMIDGNDERVNVDVALIDTGIDRSHPDLNVVGGINVYDVRKAGRWDDSSGHGTSVAGVVAALDNTEGVVGVAPGARLWSVKASTPSGLMNFRSVVRGLEWVAEHADTIEVVNVSVAFPVGGAADDLRFREAIRQVADAGVTIVVPAGNNADDAGSYAPGAYDESITVSAFSDTDGQPGGLGPDDGYGPFSDDHFAAPFSNFGAAIDICAPGTAVRSTKRGGGYDLSYGTSVSAPHVAGVAALYRAVRPDASPDQTRTALLAARERVALPDDPDGIDEGVIRAERF